MVRPRRGPQAWLGASLSVIGAAGRAQAWPAADGSGRLLTVLLVGDVLAPLGLRPVLPLGEAVPHGQVGHKVIGRGTVPVPLAGRSPDGVPRTHDDDVSAAGLDQPDALDDVQGLPVGVSVPGGTGARGEVHGVDPAWEGSTPGAMTSNHTSPVNMSAGPLPDGRLRKISMVLSSERVLRSGSGSVWQVRATVMYGAGDVQVENVPDPVPQQPTDAIVRIVRTCVCGSDLHTYHTMPAWEQGTTMGHEFLGVVEDLGTEVTGLTRGDLVVAPFADQDNTCEFCREGVQTSCRHGGFFNSAQAELIRVPQAAGTLVTLPVGEDSALLPSLLTLADVYGKGWHAAKRAHVNPRTTVTVIGDGAVGLLAVPSAKQLGAERIIPMGRHKARTDLGVDVDVEVGASYVVATGFRSVPTSATHTSTTSSGTSVNVKSGTRPVPVDSTTPRGKAWPRNSHRTSSGRRRCSCAVLVAARQTTWPPRYTAAVTSSPCGSSTSQAGRIHGPTAHEPA
jgi:D-arabinose 1-dehydrogenase-like Zn-dependent alcohol dehydrogenase